MGSFDDFGTRLMLYRKHKGFNQDQMAEYLEISRPMLSKYENNDTIPSLTLLQKMIKKDPDVNMKWFIRGLGDMYIDASISNNTNSSINTGRDQRAMNESDISYGRDAEIKALKDRIKDLERTIAVQEKLIKALEKYER